MDNRAVAYVSILILVSLGILYGVAQWQIPVQNPPDENDPVWMIYHPTKCNTLPWREEWAKENEKAYVLFPIAEDLDYMRAYYQKRDIRVLDLQLVYQNVSPTCTVCGCAESFVYGLYTYPSDAARLALSGFDPLDQGDPKLITGPLFRQSTDHPISPVSTSQCEAIFSTGTVIDEVLGNQKVSCYIQAAISARDPSVCNAISDSSAKDTCLSEVAIALRSTEPCEWVSNSGAKDSCFAVVAGILKNPGICENVQNESTYAYCVSTST